jgi:hypothetical protein
VECKQEGQGSYVNSWLLRDMRGVGEVQRIPNYDTANDGYRSEEGFGRRVGVVQVYPKSSQFLAFARFCL